MWINASPSLNPQPTLEFKQRDNRPTHELNEVVTLEDVRKAKQLKAEADAQAIRTRATTWRPKKQKGQESDDELPLQQSTKGHPQFVPTAAARQQLGVEKPAMLQRIDDTLARCRAARDNRNYRLNSLGVFEDDKNKVRARSMLRVQVHKDLSTTSMRLPDTYKEVKCEKLDTSVTAKLERMCDKVLNSISEPTPVSAPSLGARNSARPQASGIARASSPKASSVYKLAGTLDAISECSTVPEQHPTKGGRTSQHPLGSTMSTGNTPALFSRKGTVTNPTVFGTLAGDVNRDLASDFAGIGSPSRKSTGRTVAALPQVPSSAPTPAPGAAALSKHKGSKLEQASTRSRRHPRLCPRTAGPLKISPFAASLGAGSGMAPRRPILISSPSQAPEPPIYGRRSAAQASGNQHQTMAAYRQTKTVAGKLWGLSEGVPVPGELAQAHSAHLDAVTQENLARYYKQVAEAQADFLQRSGLHEDVLSMTADQLQHALSEQLKMERMEQEEENLRQNRMAHGALDPSSDSTLVQSALEHCTLMTEELDVFRASLPKPPPKSGRRRRKPSIPMGSGAKGSQGSNPPGSNPPGLLASDSQTDLGAKTQGSSEAWDLEGEWGKHAFGPDGEAIAAMSSSDGPQILYSHSMLKHRDQKRRSELLCRPPRSTSQSRQATETGQSSSELSEDEDFSADELPVEEAQQGKDLAAMRAKPDLQKNQTFTAKRLEAFKASLEDAASVDMEEIARSMPALPTIPAMPSVPLHVQARLERVWRLLHLPLPSRLDAVLEYTKHSRLLQFEHALKTWEQAAVAVLQREGIVDTLMLVQTGVEDGSIGYLTISAIERQCVRLVQVTLYIEHLKHVLKDQYAVELTYHGQSYPSENKLSTSQLVEFMEWLKDSSDSVLCLT